FLRYIGQRAFVAAARTCVARATPASPLSVGCDRAASSAALKGCATGCAPAAASLLGVAAALDSSENPSFSSTITLRPAWLRLTSPACASFSTKSRNDDAP